MFEDRVSLAISSIHQSKTLLELLKVIEYNSARRLKQQGLLNVKSISLSGVIQPGDLRTTLSSENNAMYIERHRRLRKGHCKKLFHQYASIGIKSIFPMFSDESWPAIKEEGKKKNIITATCCLYAQRQAMQTRKRFSVSADMQL